MVDVSKAEALYSKSIDVLKSVQLKNGGCLATPEGERYPYVYPRDHVMVLLAFLSAGRIAEAKNGLDFVYKKQLKNGAFPQRYNKKGEDASYKPIQLDGTGSILYVTAKYLLLTKDKKFVKKYSKKIFKAVEYILSKLEKEKNLLFTPNSIHEFPPTERGLEIWANSACCGALKKLSKVDLFPLRKRRVFHKYASLIEHGINLYFWNSWQKSFIKNIRLKESSSVLVNPDASEYGPGFFGVFHETNKKVISTVKRIEKHLWHKKLGGICRYPKYEGRNNGGWGPWPHFTLMICRHFIKRKNKKQADKYLNWVLNIAWENLLPEHLAEKKELEEYEINFSEARILREDRKLLIRNAKKHPTFEKGVAYITLPLAWPHAEFVSTWNLYQKVFLS